MEGGKRSGEMSARREFELRKQAVLRALASEEVDKSRKGGVDVQIADLIIRINAHPDYYTTSSCSGRVSLFLDPSCSALHDDDGEEESSDSSKEKEKNKKGGDWIYVSHEPAVVDEVLGAVRERYSAHQKGLLVFRFEPFILALECSSLNASQQLVSCALASGFRESGITSAGKRCIVAVRCSIRMEVPVGDEGKLLVTDEYLKYLTKQANKKMVLNKQRIDRFLSTFNATLGCEDGLCIEPVQVTTNGRKSLDRSCALKKKKQKISSKLLDKLLSSLTKRQLGILSNISLLEQKTCVTSSHNTKVVQPANISEIGRGEVNMIISLNGVEKALPVQVSSQIFGLRATPVIVKSVEPVEKLYRWGHSTCELGSAEKPGCNSVLIYGGYGGPQRHARMNDIIVFNVEEGSLRTVQTVGAPPPIMAHTASRVRDLMVVIGGRRDPTCVLSTVSVLDLKAFEWTFPDIKGVEFSPRHRHAAAVVGSRIYVYGGLIGTKALCDLYMLDTASWTWSLIICGGELPSARHSHSLAALGCKLFLFGGREGNRVYGDLHVLDLETLKWSQVKAGGIPPSPRFSHTMTVVGGDLVAVNGGCPITKDKDLVLLHTSSSMWIRLQVDWGSESLLVRHTTTLVGDKLVAVGGGAACFAFGTHFSPPLKLKLEPFLQRESCIELEVFQPLLVERNGSDEKLVSWILKIDSYLAKEAKDSLKQLGWLDPTRRSRVLDQRRYVALPILESGATFLSGQCDFLHEQVVAGSFSEEGRGFVNVRNTIKDKALRTLLACRGEVSRMEMSVCTKQSSSPFASMEEAVSAVLKQKGLSLSLLHELPKKWERLGDLVVLPAGSLTSSVWSTVGEELWRVIAVSLSAKCLARQAPIAATGTRDSQLQLLYGKDGWVEHRENGILYCFDATKCMFSSGNVSEKLRLAKMQCRGGTVVDLFAGIGYYVLPLLIKAGAGRVYACEWNPHAITALRHNLRVNGVEQLCTVLEGDNRSTAPAAVADVVCLGLLPSSEGSWPTAVSALRPEGGLLLVHANVKDSEEEEWTSYLLKSITRLATSIGRAWEVSIVHFERVKWYAPHMRHIVADVRCKQAQS